MARILALGSGPALFGLLLLAQLLLTSCSVFYGAPPSGQCSSDADCESQPALSGLVCDLEHGVCTSSPARGPVASADGCESSDICTEKNGGSSLCRVQGTPCVPLLTPECRWVEGDWKAPNALFIGSIGPHTVLESSGSPVPIPWASRAMRAMDLGLREWNEQVINGLPLSMSQLAIVHCDSSSDATRVASSMDHLTRTVRVRALISMTDLENEASADRAREVDLPALCAACYERPPSASSAGVESWRIQPPLEDQAPLMAQRAKDLEQGLRSQRPSDSEAIRVALVWQDSLGNQAFVGALRAQLRLHGLLGPAQSYLERRIPDPSREPVDALGVSAQLVDFQPEIVLVAMDSLFSSVYLLALEQQ
ncbi:MAG TPA: hypothetical protein VJU61_24840, partial [Polyangiaceae bacterium]|nr:hypothetical protein [Polyangiaceae bacterium]